MSPSKERHSLEHTAPTLPDDLPKSRSEASAAEVSERIRVTLVYDWMRSRRSDRERLAKELAGLLPAQRSYLTKEELVSRFGPSESDRIQVDDDVRAFAAEYGLEVVASDAWSAVLEGDAYAVESAFGVELHAVDVDGRRVRLHREDATLPQELARVVDHVLGLHTLPDSHRFHASAPAKSGIASGGREATRGGSGSGGASPHAAATPDHDDGDGGAGRQEAPTDRTEEAEHTEPGQLSRAYDFPPDQARSGEGLRVAVISLGGGIYQEDIERYFDHHDVARPRLTLVDQRSGRVQTRPDRGAWGTPAPLDAIRAAVDDPQSVGALDSGTLEALRWTVEVTMDVQLVGRLCPGVEIVVFLAENNNQGEYWALAEALRGPHACPIVSCSWGTLEPPSTRAHRVEELRLLDDLLLDGVLLGATVCASSGDSGAALDTSTTPPRPRVNFPASSSFALACGGTMFRHGELGAPEEVWAEKVQGVPMSSGGGFSRLFGCPDWQRVRGEHTGMEDGAGRGVPDVACKADVERGFCMLVGDRDIANGGTSAAAPFWAGLLALLSSELGASPGFINALLYTHPFRDAARSVDEGSNGTYHARPGWDPCCGLGSPLWSNLLRSLGGPKD
ncbi:MAG TPA: S53 family peptidase [Longimicrobiales bacterium]|nr:S53 family peptidase [Longimicrobiales bacterium]